VLGPTLAAFDASFTRSFRYQCLNSGSDTRASSAGDSVFTVAEAPQPIPLFNPSLGPRRAAPRMVGAYARCAPCPSVCRTARAKAVTTPRSVMCCERAGLLDRPAWRAPALSHALTRCLSHRSSALSAQTASLPMADRRAPSRRRGAR